MSTLKNMYESIDVWKRLDKQTLARYRCFRSLKNNKYTVQSLDCYRVPFDTAQINFFENQFLELLVEERPDRRSKGYDSLDEAIEKYFQ